MVWPLTYGNKETEDVPKRKKKLLVNSKIWFIDFKWLVDHKRENKVNYTVASVKHISNVKKPLICYSDTIS